jgi:hypothetical protein
VKVNATSTCKLRDNLHRNDLRAELCSEEFKVTAVTFNYQYLVYLSLFILASGYTYRRVIQKSIIHHRFWRILQDAYAYQSEGDIIEKGTKQKRKQLLVILTRFTPFPN